MSDILTPNMDYLAGNGIKLENYYVQQGKAQKLCSALLQQGVQNIVLLKATIVCTPTRAQFVTGRYQIRYGMQHGGIRPDARNAVPLSETLVSNALKTCGYNTELIGKWHLGYYREDYCPQNRGFDHFVGFYTGSEDYWVLVRNINCGWTPKRPYKRPTLPDKTQNIPKLKIP